MRTNYRRIITAAVVFLIIVLYPIQLSTGAEPCSPEWETELGLLYSRGKLNFLAQEILSFRTEEVLLPPQQTAAAEAAALPELPELVYHGAEIAKIALTFDDGPYPGKTEQYLSILSEYDAEATFFVVGEQAERYHGQLQMIVEQGSELGSHSWAHGRLDKMPAGLLVSELEKVREVVYEATGQGISFIRPPYGRYSQELIESAAELNQQLVLWNVDPRDWENPSAEKIVERVLEQVQPGSIIILHEGHQNTLEALPLLLEQLQGQGLQPVSVSELLHSYPWETA